MPPKGKKDKERTQPVNISKNSPRNWVIANPESAQDSVHTAMMSECTGRTGDASHDGQVTPMADKNSPEKTTELKQMEDRLMEAFRSLNAKVDNIDKTTKDLKAEFENRLDKVEATLNAQHKKMEDVERSINYAHKEITDQKEKTVAVEKDARNLRDKLHDTQRRGKELEKEMNEVKKQMSEGFNALERRTRDYNIRLRGVAEEKLKDVRDHRKLVAETLINNDLVPSKEVNDVVDEMEIAHPLGKPVDGKVNIIAKFFRRPYRDAVVRKAKTTKEFKDVVKVVEDLTKADMDAKRKAFPQMQAAYEQGKKVRFQKGKLVIDGREVPIQDS